MVLNNRDRGVSRGWRLGLGAEPWADRVRFRVWAPAHSRVDVVLRGPGGKRFPLRKTAGGYFSAEVAGIGAGTAYFYCFDGSDKLFPDPCSRFQPEGPNGPSMVIDPDSYRWHDAGWKGLRLPGQVLYEMHVGRFTPEGTFASAARQLAELGRLGITAIELMPVAEFSGRWNWGYDGVDLFAPSHRYGAPDQFKGFVDAAHRSGIGVILDVVYNHLGPVGCFLQEFSDSYFTDRYRTDWGRAINFDGAGAAGVRDFFIRNACYWISEYHLDGLRIDATQNIYDSRRPHILARISAACRACAGAREIVLIAENEPQETRCLAPVSRGGFGFDAMWNDDFHHSLLVGATGFREAYLQDYRGHPQELVSLVRRGFLFQGQYFFWQRKNRGSRVREEPAAAFVVYLQNHDQIGNQLEGKRFAALAGERLYRALMTFMMLSPCTPLIFMGQEFGASAPFPFFADMEGLERSVFLGRRAFIAQFPSYARAIRRFPHPCRESTFRRAALDFSQRRSNSRMYAFHKELIALRREDPVVSLQARHRIEGTVLSPQSLALRYYGEGLGERLLLLNYGNTTVYAPAPEPLLAADRDAVWRLVFSSDDPAFGGSRKDESVDFRKLRLPRSTALFFELKRGGAP